MPGTGPVFPANLKHYELKQLLGRGGMGTVIEGIDRRDGSRVAVKLLHPHLAAADPTYLDRFEREAHVAALLRSPYTVHLIDYGVDNEQYFLVMEFVEGESLAQRLANGRMAPEEALRIAGEVARALEEAGARGIVHRDIKPENVLLDPKGRVKVTDFGIARSATAPGLTVAGGFVGTPTFAAPEQVDGQFDHRSDIYALGVTLYNCLAGHPPYRGKTAMDTMFQHRTAALPMQPLSYLPDAVQNLVRRCLEKDPLDRYQSASELAGAIDRARQVLGRTAAAGAIPAAPPIAAFPQPPAPSREATGPMMRSGAPPAGMGDETRVEPQAHGGPPVHQAPPVRQPLPAAPPLAPRYQPPPAGQPSSGGGLPPGWALGTGGSAPPPPRPPIWKRPIVALGALGGAVVLGVFGAVLAVASIAGGGDDDPTDAGETPSPSASATVTATATATDTEAAAAPTATPTATLEPPAPTPTPDGGWARINEIRLQGNVYQVSFETNGFAYSLPGIHVHFFWNTVPIEQAGAPGGDGSRWRVYGGGSPFTGHTVADREPGATQLCILVANPDHSVREGTGNCFDLP